MSDDTKTGSETYHIQKLTEDNYRSWAQQLKWILDEKDLLELVEGKETAPVATEELAAWNKKVKKARSILGSSVTVSVMTYIEGMMDPVAMWRELEQRYNPKSQVTLLQLVREFMTARKDDSMDMEHHLQRIKSLKQRIEEQGEAISDTMYNSVLLNSLPDDYKIVISILEATPDLTATVIINRILEENRKIYGAGGESSKVALKTTGHQGKTSGKSSGKSKKSNDPAKLTLKCTHCDKTGHVEADCWTKQPEKRPKKDSKVKSTADGSKFAMSAKLSTNKHAVEANPVWYVDTGATDHFSPFKSDFKDLRDFDKPYAIATAKGTAHGTAIGTVTLQVRANDEIHTLYLNNAVYAPDMDDRLLSAGTLFDLGYETSLKPGVGGRICRDDIVVASLVKEGKLFRLDTVKGAAKAVTAAKAATTTAAETDA